MSDLTFIPLSLLGLNATVFSAVALPKTPDSPFFSASILQKSCHNRRRPQAIFSTPLICHPTRPCTLLWLRVGHLRLSDNPSVSAAASNLKTLLPIATIGSNELSLPVLQALTELNGKLKILGSMLIVCLVENSIHCHVGAICKISDIVHPKHLIYTEDSSYNPHIFTPLRNRFISITSFPRSPIVHCFYSGVDRSFCSGHLIDAPHVLPPPPPFASNIASDLPEFGCEPRGEAAARTKLFSLMASSEVSLSKLKIMMREELRIGSISHCRIVFELCHSPVGQRIGMLKISSKRIPCLSTLRSFFMKSPITTYNVPAVTVLGVAAYDVNGGDRRGVEWSEKTKSFVLKEWEHTANERRMNPRERVQEFVRRRRQFLFRAFFPDDVTPDYYSFTAWRFAQRCVSATIGVFGTSSLLVALGIRSGRIGQAAVISWVLKDGLGRVGKMLWAGSMGKDFDVDPKRWRFRSALLYALGNGLEIVTQIFPASFLVFATAANSMKQVSMLTSSATRNAMYRSFGEKSQNIANITAKGEAQIVIADLIGMACGIRLSKIFGSSRRHVLTAYSALTLLDIFGIYMELRQVVFRSLNAERSSIVVSRVLGDGIFLTPSQVSPKESIFLKPRYKKWVRLSSISKAARNPEELDMLLRVFRRERFLISTPRSRSGGPCRLVLSKDATNEDVLRAMLLVGYLQREIKNGAKKTLSFDDCERLLVSAQTATRKSFSWFMDGLKENGWNTDTLLFGTMKRRGYWGA